MLLLSRQYICDKLALSRWQSYHWWPATSSGYVRETDILSVLNAARRGDQPAFACVPALLSFDSLAVECGAAVAKLKLWTRRKRNPIPHVRFNSHVIRFHRTEALAWLERQSRP